MINRWGRDISAMPPSQGGEATASPRFLGTPTRAYLCPNSLTYSNEMWGQQVSRGSAMTPITSPRVPKIFGTSYMHEYEK